MGLIDFDGTPCFQLIVNALPLGGDQVAGFFELIPVMEHVGACNFGQAVDGPGIFLFHDLGQQRKVGGHGVAKPESR